MILTEIFRLIEKYDDFAIVSHTSPDGDSMGSMLGLYNSLKEMGKTADVFIEGNLPAKYSFLPGFNDIKHIDNSKKYYSLLLVLDCGDLDRIGDCKKLMDKCSKIINIDHHITNNQFGNLNYVDNKASSTGEIIYRLLKDNKLSISKDTATCLYTAILTDTGGFKYSNTTSHTFSICGDLIDTSINFSDINNRIYDTKTIAQVKLLSRVTSTLELFMNNRVAILYLLKDDLERSGAKEEDASEFVNIARDIEGVEVGALIKQINDGEYRVSLRSKNYADVRRVAECFGGGGHIRAAGCTVRYDIEEVKRLIIEEISKVMDVED